MLRPLEPQGEKFRQSEILLRSSGYRGSLPVVALTIDPMRGKVWYTDGTTAGSSLPKASAVTWTWYLVDLDNGVCFKGSKPDILQMLRRAAEMRDHLAPDYAVPRTA